MIKGIEVLSQYEVATNYSMNWTVFWIIVGIFVAIGFIVSAIDIQPDGIEWFSCVLIGLLTGLIGCSFGGLIGMATGDPIEFETQYKVLISDEVQMNEFLEKYEIIEQDGKIYTIREKGE